MRLGYLLPAVLLLPVTLATIECTSLTGNEDIRDVVTTCVYRISGYDGVNLSETEVNKFLQALERIEIGLNFTNSAVTQLEFGPSEVYLHENCFLHFENNPNLVKIDFRPLIFSTRLPSDISGLRIVNNPVLKEILHPIITGSFSVNEVTIRGNRRLPVEELETLKDYFNNRISQYPNSLEGIDISKKFGECTFPNPVQSLDELVDCQYIGKNLTFATEAMGINWTEPAVNVEMGCVHMVDTNLTDLKFLGNATDCKDGKNVIEYNKLLCDFFETRLDLLATNCEERCTTKNQAMTKECTIIDGQFTIGWAFDAPLTKKVVSRIKEIRGAVQIDQYRGASLAFDSLEKIRVSPGQSMAVEISSLFKLFNVTFGKKITVEPSDKAAWPMPLIHLGKAEHVQFTVEEIQKMVEVTGIPEKYFHYNHAKTTLPPSTTPTTTKSVPTTTHSTTTTEESKTTAATTTVTEKEVEEPEEEEEEDELEQNSQKRTDEESGNWTLDSSSPFTWILTAVSLFISLIAPLIVVALQSLWAVKNRMRGRDPDLKLRSVTKYWNPCELY